ncbi:MAG: (2Fe-2S) ferredoxin domain-containing protein [Bacteroidales bacterium]|jgi:NADH:ubiquinone oxidoreductase subunit E|nr:(2Fe-2S) ferredoxin domain-containing protein [Bacteroidales bacterium]
MNKKVNVKICIGTLCYVMGGSELQLLEEHLNDDLKKRVTIEGTTCLDYCHNEANGKPPFASVNGKCIQRASITKIINQIKKELE